MYPLSDFEFLFLIKQDLPMLSFVSQWIILYFWIFRRCMYLFIISNPWREVTFEGVWESDCLCSVPALTCDLYIHHVSYMELPHLWNRAVADSSLESDRIFMRWHHTISCMWTVPNERWHCTISSMWTVHSEMDLHPYYLSFLSALRLSSRTQRMYHWLGF